MDLAVVIPYYYGYKYLEKCLLSMFNEEVPFTYRVFIINNSGCDLRNYSNEYPNKILIVVPKENIGFGRACNLGVHIACNEGISNYLILNQDSYWAKGSFCAFVENIITNKNCLLFPMIYDYDSVFKSDLIVNNYLANLDLDKIDKQDKVELNNFPGTCMGFNQDLVDQIGLFDPVFYFYAEDYDLCQRALKSNIRLIILPKICLHHMSGLKDKIVLEESIRETRYKVAQVLKKLRYSTVYNVIRYFISSSKSLIKTPKLFYMFLSSIFFNFYFAKFGSKAIKTRISRQVNDDLLNSIIS